MSLTSAPRRGLIAAVLAASVILGVSACGTGQNWVDQGRDPWGNGQFITVGQIQGQALTVVQGPEGSKSATLVGTFINPTAEPDALVGATLGESPGTISGGSVALAPGGTSVRVGYNSDQYVTFAGVEAKPATYVPVTLTFEKAGETTVQMLVVPPTGYYEGITPGPVAS